MYYRAELWIFWFLASFFWSFFVTSCLAAYWVTIKKCTADSQLIVIVQFHSSIMSKIRKYFLLQHKKYCSNAYIEMWHHLMAIDQVVYLSKDAISQVSLEANGQISVTLPPFVQLEMRVG